VGAFERRADWKLEPEVLKKSMDPKVKKWHTENGAEAPLQTESLPHVFNSGRQYILLDRRACQADSGCEFASVQNIPYL
jgi:hypothetical protein